MPTGFFNGALNVDDAATSRTNLGISAGIGGSTGATDNAILRADGGGGATLQNSAVTIADTTGAITASAANSGAVTTHTFTNTSNDASAGSRLSVVCGGATASGDAAIDFQVSGVQTWTLGVDNSNSDRFALAASAALGTTDIMNFTPTGDYIYSISSNNGSHKVFEIQNSSNTANSGARLDIKVAGGTGDDAYTKYSVSGATDWSVGIDNSASDAFVIAASSALGTSNMLSMTTAGVTTFTGALTGADGTVSLPGYSFSGDTNCGMYRVGSDSIALAVGGAASIIISNDTRVGIGGAAANAAALLDLNNSTTKGFRLMNLTTTQRDNIGTPVSGLVIYNATTNKLNFYNGAAWEAVTSA